MADLGLTVVGVKVTGGSGGGAPGTLGVMGFFPGKITNKSDPRKISFKDIYTSF